MNLYEMVFHVDDGYNIYDEMLRCFASDSDNAVSLGKAKFDPYDLVMLVSIHELEIREGLFV